MSSGQPTRVRSERLPAGYVLDEKYEIVRAIGAGGFAYVYEANQLNIERPVAVKVLSPPRTIEDREHYFQRFVREAKLAAQIRHPNVVTIHDYGVADEQPYIVMELLQGRELKHELRDHGPMDPARALPLFIECLDALGEAHDRKIVHKDLKPSNLFLSDPGGRREMLRILDFGVARLQEGESLTQSGRVYGTMRYMAPEYLRKQTVTPALDVYQIGLILVEALAGKPAIEAEDHLVCITAHFLGELEIPESLLEGPLGSVLQKALAVGYGDRFASAHEFRDALEAIDPATITPIERGGPIRLLNDYSGSMDGMVLSPPQPLPGAAPPGDTGGHDAPIVADTAPSVSASAPVPAIVEQASAEISAPSDISLSEFGPLSGGYAPEEPRRMTTLLIGLAGGLLIAALVGAGALWAVQGDEANPVPATVTPTVAPAAKHPAPVTEPAPTEDKAPAEADPVPAAVAGDAPAAVAQGEEATEVPEKGGESDAKVDPEPANGATPVAATPTRKKKKKRRATKPRDNKPAAAPKPPKTKKKKKFLE